MNNRFINASTDDVDEFIRQQMNANTSKKTVSDMKLFTQFVRFEEPDQGQGRTSFNLPMTSMADQENQDTLICEANTSQTINMNNNNQQRIQTALKTIFQGPIYGGNFYITLSDK